MSEVHPTIQWPTGKATVESKAYAATVAVEAVNTKQVVTIAQATGDMTVNVTSEAPEVGDELILKCSADGTNRTLTCGTLLNGAAITLTASKSYAIKFEYTGSAYDLINAQQLD